MFEKINKVRKIDRQDRMQPKNAEEMIKKYSLESMKLYDYLDKMVDYINLKSEIKVSEVLWENPNPSIAFEDNTIINLKNSNYDYLEVFFIFSISEAFSFKSSNLKTVTPVFFIFSISLIKSIGLSLII